MKGRQQGQTASAALGLSTGGGGLGSPKPRARKCSVRDAGGASSHKVWSWRSNAANSRSKSAGVPQRHLSFLIMRMKRRGRWTGSPYMCGLTLKAKDQKYVSPAASAKFSINMSKHFLDLCVLLLRPITFSPITASCFPLRTSARKA